MDIFVKTGYTKFLLFVDKYSFIPTGHTISFKFHGVGVSGFFSRDIARFRAVVYPMYPETRKIQGHRVHL